MNKAVSDITSDLVDLTEVDFARVQDTLSEHGRGDSVLAHSLRRLLQEAQNPANAIAGFQATL